jgi:hypothetical protein
MLAKVDKITEQLCSIMRRLVVTFLLAVGLLLGRPAFGVIELIGPDVGDGGFETPLGSQGTNWIPSLASTTISGISFANVPGGGAGGSSGFLSMGNVNGPQTQIIFQQVTIPTNTLLLEYSYFWEAISSDPANSAGLSTSIGNALVAQELNGNTGGYAFTTFTTTNFAGQTIDVVFRVDTATNFGFNSTFNIDNVSLFAFTPADIPPNDFFTNSTVISNDTNKISVIGTNLLATSEPKEPKIGNNPVGGHSLWWNWTAPSNGIVTISTIGSTFSTLLGVFTGDSVSNLTQIAANSSGASSQVKVPVSAGSTYQIDVDGKNGASGLIELNLAFSLDTKGPTVTITSPANNAKLTNSTVVVKGTASDNVGVASVQLSVGNAQGTNVYQADGTNTWTATVTNLIPGPNTISAVSVDTSGNKSATVARTVTFVVVSPLTVNISGSGTVSPDLNGKLEDVGADITLTAKPGAGQVFSNWMSGDVELATTAALTFTMQSNLVLQANFVPNPFTPVAGTYQGLFYNTDTPDHVSSGFLNLTLSSSGSYSAKIIVAGLSYSLSGQFSAGGAASNNIVRKGLPAVSVQMQLDFSGGSISGQLSDGDWLAQLGADPVVTSATAARYTMIIPGADVPVAQPGEEGYATVTVSSTGGIGFAGALTDGTKVSQKANLLTTGQWAFYVPLYSGKGSIFGWLTFSDQPDSDFAGIVNWFKLTGASGKLYPNGFTNTTGVAGSLYQFTNGVPVLNFTNNNNGVFAFQNGNLASGLIDQVTLSTANKITNDGTNKLTASITTSSGLFKVTTVNPSTGKSITGNGVVFQKGNFGGGFFLGTNESGSISLNPVEP